MIDLKAYCLRSTLPGIKKREIAMMSPRFATTLPTALPTAISIEPRAVAMTETMSSGRVVATETTVAPTRRGDTPRISAVQDAASTNQSPPLTIITMPRASSATESAISPADPIIIDNIIFLSFPKPSKKTSEKLRKDNFAKVSRFKVSQPLPRQCC